jgi:hypothetical protein
VFQTVKEGFSFGLGSSFAHNVIGSLFGHSNTKQEEKPPEPKYTLLNLYSKCLDKGHNCDFLLKKIYNQNEYNNSLYTLTQLYEECHNSSNYDCSFLSQPPNV